MHIIKKATSLTTSSIHEVWGGGGRGQQHLAVAQPAPPPPPPQPPPSRASRKVAVRASKPFKSAVRISTPANSRQPPPHYEQGSTSGEDLPERGQEEHEYEEDEEQEEERPAPERSRSNRTTLSIMCAQELKQLARKIGQLQHAHNQQQQLKQQQLQQNVRAFTDLPNGAVWLSSLIPYLVIASVLLLILIMALHCMYQKLDGLHRGLHLLVAANRTHAPLVSAAHFAPTAVGIPPLSGLTTNGL
jgi:TolA-binding protein